MGEGHSVQSNEQEANFNQEMQSDLGTEGNTPKSPAEMPPNGTLALLEDIRLRLGNPFTSCLPVFPGHAVSSWQQALFTSSVLGNLPSDPSGLAPINPCQPLLPTGPWWPRGQAADWRWR